MIKSYVQHTVVFKRGLTPQETQALELHKERFYSRADVLSIGVYYDTDNKINVLLDDVDFWLGHASSDMVCSKRATVLYVTFFLHSSDVPLWIPLGELPVNKLTVHHVPQWFLRLLPKDAITVKKDVI